MADLIPSGMGQQMAQAGTEPQQPSPDDHAAALAQAQQDFQNAPAGQPSDSGEQRPVGTAQDQRDAEVAKDPSAKVQASPHEQAQYVQLVTRFILMISDNRKHSPDHPSPSEAALKQLNNPKLSVAQAVGQTTAQLIFILHNAAKSQKVQYDPDVLFHAADECIAATYLKGLARGLFHGVPDYKGIPSSGEYPFEPAEMHMLAQAKIYAVQWFGRLMQQTGQITPAEKNEAMNFWQQQIKREVNSGQVSDQTIEKLIRAHMMSQGDQPPSDTSDAGQAPQQGQQQQEQAQPEPQQPPPDQGGGVAPQQPPAGAQ